MIPPPCDHVQEKTAKSDDCPADYYSDDVADFGAEVVRPSSRPMVIIASGTSTERQEQIRRAIAGPFAGMDIEAMAAADAAAREQQPP